MVLPYMVTIYHQYTPNVSIYTIHGSYGSVNWKQSETIRWNNWDHHSDGTMVLRFISLGRIEAVQWFSHQPVGLV